MPQLLKALRYFAASTLLIVLLSAGLFLRPGNVSAATDMSGEWEFVLTHPQLGGLIVCAATLTQVNSSLSASMTCDQFGAGTLSGAAYPYTDSFYLIGTLGGSQAGFAGESSGGGTGASGIWAASPYLGEGSFSGMRAGASGGVGGVTELADVSGAAPMAADPARKGGTNTKALWLGGAAFAGVAVMLAAIARKRRPHSTG